MNTDQPSHPPIKVLLELRPALDGFAGIPQEARLLFNHLRRLSQIEIDGLLQTSGRKLQSGLAAHPKANSRHLSEAEKVSRLSGVVISVTTQETGFKRKLQGVRNYFHSIWLALKYSLGFRRIRLSNFVTRGLFEDFIWRTLFSKTLGYKDFENVTSANFRIVSIPWRLLHMTGLRGAWRTSSNTYGQLETPDYDVFISQNPYPARVSDNTALVVRYHDALPILMPHTIPEKSFHKRSHFFALAENVRQGAWFACVSQTTRNDLLKIFPEAESRSVAIHNMVSQHFFEEDSSSARIPTIVRTRITSEIQPKFLNLREQEAFYTQHVKPDFHYLLMVSTIEPRKNHVRLLAAWEALKAKKDPSLKLVIVGTLGWDFNPILAQFSTWQARGELFVLSQVPAPDLRVLYKHALATVCPSLGEGFDFSGVEAMSSGGIVAASDIPVHREVYDDAAEYFNPYSTAAAIDALERILYSENSLDRQRAQRERGAKVAARYSPEAIMPQWQSFFATLKPAAK